MSLQVWLPLTKDLRQQGLSNVTVTNNGAAFNSAGKLGGCYSFNGSSNYLNFNEKVITSTSYSISFWIKVANVSGNKCIICCRSATNYAFAIYLIGANIRIDTGSNWSTGYSLTAGNWYHVVFTTNGTAQYLYVNGLQVTTRTASTSINQITSFCTIGAEHTNGSNIGVYFSGQLNDVRIYDHCLSSMEIKELAKGLVLHYPLNRGGWGQENLGNFASVVSNWTMESLSGSNYIDSSYGNVIKLVTNSTNQRMYNYVPASMWQNGKVYTVSFLAKADTNGRTCDMSRSIADFSPTFTLTTNWKRYNGKITSTATPNGGTLSFRIHQSGATVYITQIKVEEGELVTPYCPHYNESLYTTMGLNSTTKYDCSGYCNNAISNGSVSLTYSSDTPKYSVSTVFASGARIATPVSASTFMPTDSITVSIWFKSSNAGNRFISCTEGGGFNFESNSGNIRWITYIYGKGYAICDSTTSWASVSDNQWHMLTGTNDKQTLKIYLDGNLIKESVSQYPNIAIAYASSTPFTLGAEAQTIAAPLAGDYVGSLSDCRIYATALSADDIKSLYQNSAYIDSLGNIYGAIHSEV